MRRGYPTAFTRPWQTAVQRGNDLDALRLDLPRTDGGRRHAKSGGSHDDDLLPAPGGRPLPGPAERNPGRAGRDGERAKVLVEPAVGVGRRPVIPKVSRRTGRRPARRSVTTADSTLRDTPPHSFGRLTTGRGDSAVAAQNVE
jgi:hypothetical protein